MSTRKRCTATRIFRIRITITRIDGREHDCTGPLVAALDRRDAYHAWAREQLEQIAPPLLTCEAVLAEACHLLRDLHGGKGAVMQMLRCRGIAVSFALEDEVEAVARLLERYENVPIALADACLVRMAEMGVGRAVLTLDGDFRVYRRHGRRAVPLVIPDNR